MALSHQCSGRHFDRVSVVVDQQFATVLLRIYALLHTDKGYFPTTHFSFIEVWIQAFSSSELDQ